MSERIVTTTEELRSVLSRVSFAPSCVNLKWEWEMYAVGGVVNGWFVGATFERPDTNTGLVARSAGRQEFIHAGASVSYVVKTCWLLAELIVRHELMEAFLFDGVKIFNPHHTVEELSMPHRAREGRAA